MWKPHILLSQILSETWASSTNNWRSSVITPKAQKTYKIRGDGVIGSCARNRTRLTHLTALSLSPPPPLSLTTAPTLDSCYNTIIPACVSTTCIFNWRFMYSRYVPLLNKLLSYIHPLFSMLLSFTLFTPPWIYHSSLIISLSVCLSVSLSFPCQTTFFEWFD